MKNKMICALLTTVMVLSFAACGSQGNAAASAESTVTSESGAERPMVLHMKTTLQFPQRMLPLSLKRSRMP